MAAVRKKITIGKFNPFWSQDNYEAFMDTVKDYSVRDTYPHLVYKNNEYLPFYALGSDVARGAAVKNMLVDTPSIGGVTMPRVFHEGNATSRSTMKKLYDEKKYAHLVTALDRGMYNLSSDNLKLAANKLWETSFRQPDTAIYLPVLRSHTGALNIIKCMKQGTRWGIGYISTKGAEGPFKSPQYLFGKYFLAYVPNIVTDLKQRTANSGYPNQYQHMYGCVPLASLMIKKEDYTLVRANQLANNELDASLLELWVDKSLVEGSQHPIKQQFVRAILNPMMKIGIQVKTFDSLTTEMYHQNRVPKFKTLDGEEKWVKERAEDFMDAERASYGIILEKKNFDKALHSLLDVLGK